MGDFAIIDSHVHLWDPARLDYPWLTDVPAIGGPHLPQDYRAACAGYDVEKLVFVQCDTAPRQARDEVRWVAELAAGAETRIAAIVAWAPVSKGEAAEAELDWLASMPLVRGVRQLIQSEADDGYCARPDFVRGVRLLGARGLSFDLCIKGDGQFESVLELVGQCPDVNFVLDHLGKPFIAQSRIEPWANHIRRLAQAPNVACKVSGMCTEADWEDWSAQDLRPYAEIAFEAFGADRIMFGGDWPVVNLAATWTQWLRTLNELAGGFSEADRRKLFRDNAASFYRI